MGMFGKKKKEVQEVFDPEELTIEVLNKFLEEVLADMPDIGAFALKVMKSWAVMAIIANQVSDGTKPPVQLALMNMAFGIFIGWRIRESSFLERVIREDNQQQ